MSGIALKLTSLLVRTVAKPIATTLKAQAKEHETFRLGCIRIAQTIHSTDLRLRMSLLGESKIKIRPLNDNKAIEQGANFLSEFFIFSVAGGLIFYESYRSRKKASNEKDAVAVQISTLEDEIQEIRAKLREYDAKLGGPKSTKSVVERVVEAVTPHHHQSPPPPPTPAPAPAPALAAASPTSSQVATVQA